MQQLRDQNPRQICTAIGKDTKYPSGIRSTPRFFVLKHISQAKEQFIRSNG